MAACAAVTAGHAVASNRISDLLLRKTGILPLARRDSRQIRRLLLPFGIRRRPAPGEKPRNGADLRSIGGNERRDQTGWLRKQSWSPRSPPPNSLATGKSTGNFAGVPGSAGETPRKVSLSQRVSDDFPTPPSREFLAVIREFCLKIREFESGTAAD